MSSFFKKNWFMLGLISVAALAVLDSSGLTVNLGLWLKAHYGPDIVIVLIFFLSGLALDTSQVRSGFADYRGTLIALALIFIAAPITALVVAQLPLETGILIGLLLVSAMPTTLSSGVVMTGSAGGNMAHALLVTIIANTLAVFTIPLTLGFLLSLSGESRTIMIDQLPIMLKITKLVLLPLMVGLLVRNNAKDVVKPFLPYTSLFNQIGILSVVWMGSCQGRDAIVSNLSALPAVLGVTFTFHFLLVIVGLLAAHISAIGKGRRESVILMGGQKTLPLSIILQVSLFPEYGLALGVCVLHHITHLAMDAFLVQYLRDKK